jgi:hypothetical protein
MHFTAETRCKPRAAENANFLGDRLDGFGTFESVKRLRPRVKYRMHFTAETLRTQRAAGEMQTFWEID